ncbi:PmoA family protein [Streptomyces sp. G35A]
MSGDDSAVLRVAGRPVARYVTRPELPARLSPRPYLHPVTTLAGTAVTELSPADHAHHLGVGVAVPDVEGFNFWGGRTYVRDRGPTELDNHGSQRHTSYQLRDPDGFVEELRWVAAPGELLRERRTVAATGLTDRAWALDLTFSLTNVTSAPLSLGSPATNGRPGAAYGGFFWRARKEETAPDVFTAGAEGETEAHGRRADWLALAGSTWTLVFAGATEPTRRDPWFVRTAEYPGVGSSLAHGARLPVPPGETVVRRVVTVVADGRLGRDEAAALVRKAVSV